MRPLKKFYVLLSYQWSHFRINRIVSRFQDFVKFLPLETAIRDDRGAVD